MKIFEIKNGIVSPTEEILSIFPFSDIWIRDNHVKKDLALREFAYIEFMCSPKDTNPFFGYTQTRQNPERSRKIIENKFKEYPQWQPDELILMALDQYNEFYHNASPNLKFYESNRNVIDKLRYWYDNLDMSAVNERTGNPLYKPKEITSAVADADTVMSKLDAMKQRVYQEVFDVAKTKGNKAISKFEA